MISEFSSKSNIMYPIIMIYIERERARENESKKSASSAEQATAQ